MVQSEYEMIKELFDEKLDRLHDLQIQTLEQAKKTNGRVTKLESETEVIRFIGRHKWTLWIIGILMYAMTIKEIRDIAIASLI